MSGINADGVMVLQTEELEPIAQRLLGTLSTDQQAQSHTNAVKALGSAPEVRHPWFRDTEE